MRAGVRSGPFLSPQSSDKPGPGDNDIQAPEMSSAKLLWRIASARSPCRTLCVDSEPNPAYPEMAPRCVPTPRRGWPKSVPHPTFLLFLRAYRLPDYSRKLTPVPTPLSAGSYSQLPQIGSSFGTKLPGARRLA